MNDILNQIKNFSFKNKVPITVKKINGEITTETRDGALIENENEPEDYLAGAIFSDLMHIEQTELWDCGVTCLSMILQSMQKENSTLAELKKQHFGTITWTLNLAYILHEYKIPYTYYTRSTKINVNYETDVFSLQQKVPEKEMFLKQLELVLEKEKNIEVNNIQIIRGGINSNQLKNFLLSGNVAITLVNSLLIGCKHCHSNLFQGNQMSKLVIDGEPFRGHYILIVGYNQEKDVFLYKNPSSSQSVCFAPSSVVEEARRSYGTEENIIIVSINKNI